MDLDDLFGRAPAPPPSAAPAAPAAQPSAPALDDFFAALAATAPPSPAPAEPVVIPETFKAPKPTSAIDVRAVATEALAKTGYFDEAPAAAESEVSEPAAYGLFRGVVAAGRKKRPLPPTGEPPKIKVTATSLKDLFALDAEPKLAKTSRVSDARRKEGVGESSELKRIVRIPKRRYTDEELAEIARELTAEFRRPGGTQSLWPKQAESLYEARQNDGLFAPVSVGGGKTLISLLLAAVMRSQTAVILVPPNLRAQLIDVDIPKYGTHWKLPLDRIRIVAYTQVSNARSHSILDEIKPDLIAADEVHNLRHRTAARTKRFLRYMREHPGCRFAGMSGTITRKSIRDYQHLIELALKKNSPLPNDYGTLCEWAEALDVVEAEDDSPMAPGALLQLCDDAELDQVIKIVGAGALNGNGIGAYRDDSGPTISQAIEVQSVVRKAFRRRLVETPGVVASEDSSVASSLNITALRPPVPAELQKAIIDVRTTWEIDGDELYEALAVARITRQLAAGFRYRWMWPPNPRFGTMIPDDPEGARRGVPGRPEPKELVDNEWLAARKDWHREVREILKLSRRGMDSPMLIAQACDRGEYLSEFWDAWKAVKTRQPPPVQPIWTSDFLVKDAITFARENGSKANPLIIWYSWDCIGRKIAADGGFPLFGPGKEASTGLTRVDASQTPIIVCSIAAHGTGKNLQAFTQSLVTTPPSGGTEWEQLLGRLHRPGQLADEVNFYVYVHTRETENAFRAAVRQAQYVESTTGQKQKLNYAEKIGFSGDAFTFKPNASAESVAVEGITWEGSNIDLLFGKLGLPARGARGDERQGG